MPGNKVVVWRERKKKRSTLTMIREKPWIMLGDSTTART